MSKYREEKAQELKELRANTSVEELENVYKAIELAHKLGFFGADYHAKDAVREIKSYLWDDFVQAEEAKAQALADYQQEQDQINDLPF